MLVAVSVGAVAAKEVGDLGPAGCGGELIGRASVGAGAFGSA